MEIKTIPGKSTLNQLRLTCERTEQLESCKLVGLARAAVVAGKRKTLASFEEVEDSSEFPGLVFIQISEGDDIDEIKAEQEGEGREFLFIGEAFVENSEATIAVFR